MNGSGPTARRKAIEEALRQNRETVRKAIAAIEPVRIGVVPSIAQRFAAAVPRIQEIVAPALETLARFREEWERSLPTNWRGMSVDTLERVIELMNETNWALVWVPSRDTLERMLASRTRDPARRLVRFEPRILPDLEACLGEVTEAELRDARDALREAIDSHSARQYRAAQTLAAVALTALIRDHFDPPTLSAVRRTGASIDPEEVAFRMYRRAMIFQRLAGALEQFGTDDPAPKRYNRHASAHTVAPEQFTRANSLAALMLSVAFLREVQREFEEEAGG